MIAATEPTTLLDQWRHRFGGRRRRHRRPRPLAALGYLAHGPVLEGLVEIEKLLLVILHDAPIGHGQQMLRLAGFGAARVPWGIKWGGPSSRFLKNLLLQPVPGGPGLRLSPAAPICCGWGCNWTAIWSGTSAIRRFLCGNSFACRASGPASRRLRP